MVDTGHGLSLPLISSLISRRPISLPPLTFNMMASRVQCHGCERWFSPRGHSQHVSKTRDTRCRDVLTVSRAPRASSSIQRTAAPPLLSPNGALPASRGGSDTEIAVTRGSSDIEIAVTQGACYCFSFIHVSEILPTISDTEDVCIDPPDPADVADADAYEELSHENLTATPPTLPDQTTLPEVPEIPDLRQREDQTGENNQADLMSSQRTSASTVVDEFPFGSPGMPIPDRRRGSTVYELRQVSTDSPWAPFHSELDWTMARWMKMHGSTSRAVTQLLEMPGVRGSSLLITYLQLDAC